MANSIMVCTKGQTNLTTAIKQLIFVLLCHHRRCSLHMQLIVDKDSVDLLKQFGIKLNKLVSWDI